MSARTRLVKSLPLLAIVAFVAALMVLPAGAFASRIGAESASAAPSSVPATTATAAETPSANPAAPSELSPLSSSVLSGLPSSLSHVPWVASLTGTGPKLATLTSLPNLELLKHPATAVDGAIHPFYVAQPAPLGLTDYGLGRTTYSYNTSHILGQVTFSTPPNATDPGASDVIEPSADGEHNGYVGSPYEFGIQLNTVATNISIPGSDQGFFWTQNVVNFNDTGIHFLDDTFNMTSATQNPYFIAPGTIYSACNNNSAGVEKILITYGGVFQCVGGTVPLSPASYPVTVQLYNNATLNSDKRTVVSYGYRIVESGTGQVFTGVASDVVFNNPAAPVAPANPPGFSIDGFAPSPTGLFRDAEIVLVGSIGGDNTAFRSVHATEELEYSNASSGGFRSVPSAYNFGGDTGETGTGIADYWTPSHTLVMNPGPTMLYGLWNAEPYVSVRSGAIHISGSISPSYGFIFVSNTPPVLDPGNYSLGERDNMSWMPTTDTGRFNTYLPPPGAPWTTSYYVQAFAAGYGEVNGTAITGSVSSYHLTLPLSPGSLRAPLYAFSNAQAASLANAVTGSSTPPYVFSGLVDNINFTFNHLNDYGYPTFALFMTQGVTAPIFVNDIYEGTDSGLGNFYFADYAFPPEQGMLWPGPAIYYIPLGTSGINIFDGVHDDITDQTTAADGYGLQINLWQDTDASVVGVVSELGSLGVWVGDSVSARVVDVNALSRATGVTDLGSAGTSVSGVVANDALGVDGLSSLGSSYTGFLVENGGVGVETGADYGAESAYDPYYYLAGTTDAQIRDLSVYSGSLGANISLSTGTTVQGISASFDSAGVFFDASPYGQVSAVAVLDGSIGVYLHNSPYVVVKDVTADDHSVGVFTEFTSDDAISYVTANRYSIGAYLVASTHITLSHIRAHDHSIAVIVIP